MLEEISQNNEARLLMDERFLRRIALLYYEDGQTQEAIAGIEYCSRQTISKALQRAKDRGIVRISVIPEQRTGYLRNLARDLRLKLDLDDLIIVPGREISNVIADEVLADITSASADYLDQLLTNTDILAVSGGRAIMRNLVRYLKPTKLLPNLRIVPTIGFVKPYASFGDPNLIAFDIATAYGAKHFWLPVPAIVETKEQCEQARALILVRDVLKLINQANIVVTGLWLPHSTDDLLKAGTLSQKQIDILDTHHVAVDINHWAFDANGKCINEMLDPPPYYLTGLEIPRLRERIRKEKIKVILVAGASLAYVSAIRAALKAGLANILVTDHVTAELLLESASDGER